MLCNVLIVIDMQNDFIDGSLGSPEAQAIVENVKNKIREYKNAGKHVIFTKDTHNEDYLDTFEGQHLPIEHCIHGTYGWRVRDDLIDIFKDCENLEEAFTCVQKPTFGTFHWSRSCFLQWAGISIREGKEVAGLEYHGGSVELCGLCTDICVISNALILRAMYPATDIVVDATCCAGVTVEKHKAALEVMKSCQIDVINNE